MIIDSINLNHIRIFECVYRTSSMTKAAEELHMTQSGVSQHIKLLEEILEIKLFDRIKQRLIPTNDASELFKSCSASLYNIENAITHIKGGDQVFAGKVRIGIPIEFGNNIVIPHLSRFAKAHPKVKFKFIYGFASTINDELMSGNLDFAFVDDYTLDKQIETHKVYDETFILCCSESYLESKKVNINNMVEDKKLFESLDYVSYLEDEPVIRMWFKHHFNFSQLSLNSRSYSMDVQGIARLIQEDLGVGVLPKHLIEKLSVSGTKLHVFKGSGFPFLNTIRMAYLKGKTQTPTISALIQSFLSLGHKIH